MCQRVRIPKCCDTLIYSSLTVPKGDCNIKYDCPRLGLAAHDTALHDKAVQQHARKRSSQSQFHFLKSESLSYNCLSHFFFYPPPPFSISSLLFVPSFIEMFSFYFGTSHHLISWRHRYCSYPHEALAMPLGVH